MNGLFVVRRVKPLPLSKLDFRGFPGGSVVKTPPANTGEAGSIPDLQGQEDSLEKAMTTHSSIPALGIPWTRLQSLGLHKSWT